LDRVDEVKRKIEWNPEEAEELQFDLLAYEPDVGERRDARQLRASERERAECHLLPREDNRNGIDRRVRRERLEDEGRVRLHAGRGEGDPGEVRAQERGALERYETVDDLAIHVDNAPVIRRIGLGLANHRPVQRDGNRRKLHGKDSLNVDERARLRFEQELARKRDRPKRRAYVELLPQPPVEDEVRDARYREEVKLYADIQRGLEAGKGHRLLWRQRDLSEPASREPLTARRPQRASEQTRNRNQPRSGFQRTLPSLSLHIAARPVFLTFVLTSVRLYDSNRQVFTLCDHQGAETDHPMDQPNVPSPDDRLRSHFASILLSAPPQR